MFCIKICFLEPEPVGTELFGVELEPEPIFLPGSGVEKKNIWSRSRGKMAMAREKKRGWDGVNYSKAYFEYLYFHIPAYKTQS